MAEDLRQPLTLSAPAGELARATASAALYATWSTSEATRRAYRSQWDAFTHWCGMNGATALPCLPKTLAAYIAKLADAAAAVATIDQALAAIAKAHHLAGHPNPRRFPEVTETRAGIRRRLGVAPTKKQPLPVGALLSICERTRPGLIGWRDRAVLLVGWAGGFRRGELVALDCRDITETADGLQLVVRRAKNDQEGAGRTLGIPWGSVPATCPVKALTAWLTAAAIYEGPVFRAVDRRGKLGGRLGDRDVARLVKRAAESVGFTPASFSGHSLRSGLASAAARAGKSNRAIKRQTGHRSDRQLEGYVHEAELFRDNAADGIGL